MDRDASSNATSSNPNHPTDSLRRVLGDVSPNVRAVNAIGPTQRKTLTGSPLKRDSSAMGNGSGFTYLKKRRLSVDRPLSDMCHTTQRHGRESAPESRNKPLQMASVPDEIVPRVQQTVPTEPGTPVDFVDHEEEANDSSADRRSFSSLINYDPSSQNASQNVADSQNGPSGLLFQGPSYAELLKLRLRVAMYKVRTDQVHISFDDLEAQNKIVPRTEPTEVEDAVAKLREEAYRKQAQAQAQAQARSHAHPMPPMLLSAPILRPTSYSSRRVIYEPVPSSPPVAMPSAQVPFVSATPGRRGVLDEAELTSSIVKGRVAEGLLGLRHAV